MPLADAHAQRGKTPRLEAVRLEVLLREVPTWTVVDVDGHSELRRTFNFRDFRELMAFVNHMAEVAEAEQHHPDFTVHYSRLDVALWTHDFGGLTENDFILAAKIDRLL